MSGAALGPLHGVPVAIKDLFDFKPGWLGHLRGRARAQEQRRRLLLRVRRAHRERRRDHRRQDQQPGDGLPRHLRQLPVRAVAQSVQPGQEHRRVVGRQRRGRRRRPAAAGRRHRRRRLDPHPVVLVRRLRLQAVVRARAVRRAPQCLRRRRAVPVRRADHAHGRGCRARAHRARGLRSARSLQPRRAGGLHRRDAPLDPGLEDRLQPGLRRVPDGSPGDRCGRPRRARRSRRPAPRSRR